MNPDPFANSNPPENPQKKKHAVRKRVLIIIVAVLFAAALSAAGYFVWKNYSGTTQTAEDESTLTPGEQAAKEKFAEIDAANMEAAQEKLDTASGDVDKAKAYLELANVASAKDDNRAALDYAQKAVAADPSVDSYVAVAVYASALDRYSLAAEMYGKAADAVRAAGGDNADYEYDNYMMSREQMQEMM